MFDLTEEQQLIQETAAKFAATRLIPNASAWDQQEDIPRAVFDELAELGFMGVPTPDTYGGSGLGNFELVLILEEINRGCASTGVTLSVHNSLVQGPLYKFGADALKKKYLPKLTNAAWIGAYCLTEPQAGSDAANQHTTAVKDGDHYVLNGSKIWITNGAWADLFIVFARTDKTQRTKGISCFIVERGFPGFSVGKKEKKMGIRGSSTTVVNFDNCRVPAVNMLGEEGRGFNIAMDTLNGGRIGIATQSVGIARAALELSVKHAKERVTFGKPIADYQAIQWKLADMAMNIDAARLLVYRAATLRDRGANMAKEAAMAKLFASEICNRAVQEGVQIHGGYGYTKDYTIERLFRDARITEIYEGTSEIQRIVIAKHLLG